MDARKSLCSDAPPTLYVFSICFGLSLLTSRKTAGTKRFFPGCSLLLLLLLLSRLLLLLLLAVREPPARRFRLFDDLLLLRASITGPTKKEIPHDDRGRPIEITQVT